MADTYYSHKKTTPLPPPSLKLVITQVEQQFNRKQTSQVQQSAPTSQNTKPSAPVGWNVPGQQTNTLNRNSASNSNPPIGWNVPGQGGTQKNSAWNTKTGTPSQNPAWNNPGGKPGSPVQNPAWGNSGSKPGTPVQNPAWNSPGSKNTGYQSQTGSRHVGQVHFHLIIGGFECSAKISYM